MFVAWWTGRGFVTIFIVVASVIAVQFARSAFDLPDIRVFVGLALIVAAVVNWFIGRLFNRKSLAKVRSLRMRDRILYRARHKFMSIPMETFSIVLFAIGAVAIGTSFIST